MPSLVDRSGRPPTVLLVEDNAHVRRSIAQTLRRNGYAVVEAPDSYEALEIVQSRQGGISLVVTDMVLPGMNGIELARGIGRSDPNLPVVFMSAYGDDPWRLSSEVPEGRFLKKPFALMELLQLVRSSLEL
jgi:two-component system cell cycle sensor histidine kinase/response regulator CckA